MTQQENRLDREQVRLVVAEVEGRVADGDYDGLMAYLRQYGPQDVTDDALLLALATHCLVLLAELEQAEREVARVEEIVNVERHRRVKAEARLAKVPALVDAAQRLIQSDALIIDVPPDQSAADLISALAAWDPE